MTLGATVSGESAGCSVSGAGAYLPGATATVTAVPGGSALFLAWTGNVPYADPNAATTTLPVDNFRVVNAEFGTLISTRPRSARTRPASTASARTSTSRARTGRPSATTPRRSPARSTGADTRSPT